MISGMLLLIAMAGRSAWSFIDKYGSPRGSRLRRIAITIVCATLGVVGGLFILLAYSGRRPPPQMYVTEFKPALLRWQTQGPKNYVMEIQIFGQQSGEMTVGVFNGRPIHVSRNGTVTPEHTWQHWTIDGLFEIIRRDLEGLDEPARAFGMAKDNASRDGVITDGLLNDGAVNERGKPPVVVQQAEFDEELGYPRRYRRSVQNTSDEIEWEIVRFEVR